MIRDYEDCCRLCLSKEQMLLSIFGQDEIEKVIAPKILYCYSLFVFPQDPFSKHLCLRCFCRLEESWSFRQNCFLNSRQLIKSLLDDASFKGSEQYLKSLDNATKTTTVHSLQSCKTTEEISQIYRHYESLIDFSFKIEDVELIDICSDEEDSKELVQAHIQRNSRTLSNSNPRQSQLECSPDEPISSLSKPDSTTRSSRRSVSSDVSDDACSSYSDQPSSSLCSDRTTVDDSSQRLSREQRALGIDLNSNVEDLDKTRRTRKIDDEDKTLVNIRSELRRLRPLLKKDKNSEPSSRTNSPENRSRRSSPKNRKSSPSNKSLRSSDGRHRRSSASYDNDANSFGSRDSLNTINSDSSTNSRKQGKRTRSLTPDVGHEKTAPASSTNSRKQGKRTRSPTPEVGLEKTSEPASKKQKLNGQLSGCKIGVVNSGPLSKKLRSSENTEVNNVAVSSSVGDSSVKKYTCKYCSKLFKLKIKRKQHMKVCSEKKIINCKYCLKRMYREEDLWKHNLCHVKVYITRLPQNRHRCLKCNRFFYPKPALKKHRKKCKVPVKDVKVSSNAGTSSRNITRASPIRDNPNGRDFRSKRTRSKADLPLKSIDLAKVQPISHGLNMETSADYINTYCKYCHDYFEDSAELWKHMLIGHKFVTVHAPSKSDAVNSLTVHRCTNENCRRRFTSLKDLILHTQTHILLKCRYCDFTTNMFYSMKRHPSECQLNPDKTNVVVCCNLQFRNNYNFYVHKMIECYSSKMPVHSSAETSETSESEKCGVCSETIGPGSEELLVHLINHARSNVRANSSDVEIKQTDVAQASFLKIFKLCPREWCKENSADSFECAECKDSFLTLQNFQDHQKACFILSCVKCKLNFSNNYDFIVHECVSRCRLCLTQLRDKCHVCLAREVIVFSPITKKFKCTICNISLVNLIAAKKHILLHFPIYSAVWLDNVKCGICNEKLSNELTLNIHYYLKHRPMNRNASKRNTSKSSEDANLSADSSKFEENHKIKEVSSSKSVVTQKALEDNGIEVECFKTPEKFNSAIENQSPNGVKILTSPRYKIGDKDYSWSTTCPSTPLPVNSCLELTSELS